MFILNNGFGFFLISLHSPLSSSFVASFTRASRVPSSEPGFIDAFCNSQPLVTLGLSRIQSCIWGQLGSVPCHEVVSRSSRIPSPTASYKP